MKKNLIKSKALNPHDLIGTCSPSHWITAEKLSQADGFLRDKGHKLKAHTQINERDGTRQAGNHKERAQAVNDLFADDAIKAIIVTSGGNRALHILDYLNYDLIEKNPKPLIGYSDATAYLNAIHQKTGLVTYHGNDLGRLMKIDEADHWTDIKSCLYGENSDYESAFKQATPLKMGTATGRLVGGNLCLLSNLWGTHYAPNLDGTILFFEDEKETLWNLDRMLLAMKRVAGIENIKGIMVGAFTECIDYKDPTPEFGLSFEDLIIEHLGHLDIPIIMNAPFGHIGRNVTLPLGIQAELTATNSDVTFKLLDKPVL